MLSPEMFVTGSIVQSRTDPDMYRARAVIEFHYSRRSYKQFYLLEKQHHNTIRLKQKRAVANRSTAVSKHLTNS